MGQFPDPTWMAGFRDRVNGDAELAVIGRWFTTDFAVTFGDTRYVLHVREGRIADVTANPRFDVRSQFGMRAPLKVWRRFLQENPPPFFHDFFAMLMRVPEFVLDGDTLVAMQNARALHRMMNLMQGMGETHA